jgi:polysaccharide biosynthesis protein PslG
VTRQATYFAVAALLLIGGVTVVLLPSRGEDSGPCFLTSTECASIESFAPDPGGDEDALVTTPPAGIAFGFNDSPALDGVEQSDFEAAARTAGANARRFPVDWQQLELEQDVWNEGGWLYYQRVYDEILAASMTPVINFGFAPPWARDPGDAQTCLEVAACRYPPSRSMLDEWRELVAEVARRFPKAVFEVWNEPNLAIFWRPAPEPERFAELQAIAFKVIKSINPESIVLAGGLASNGEYESRLAPTTPSDLPLKEFLDRAMSSEPGLRGHMDALSFHPYPYSPELGEGSPFAKGFSDVREVLAAHGEPELPLWVTETGIASEGAFAVDEEDQANTIARLVSRIATMPDVEGLFLHRLLPPPPEAASPTERGYAFLRSPIHPFEPKPAFCRLVELAENTYERCASTAR